VIACRFVFSRKNRGLQLSTFATESLQLQASCHTAANRRLADKETPALQQTVPLFNDLVGAREQHQRYGEVEHLGD
jgi:hypothetical protein